MLPHANLPRPSSPCTEAIYLTPSYPSQPQSSYDDTKGLRIAHIESIQPASQLDSNPDHITEDVMRSKLAEDRFRSFAITRHVVLGIMSVLVIPIFACEGVVMFTGMKRDMLSTIVVVAAGLMKMGMIYQMMSERINKLKKWANLKAFAILNIISAVVFPALVAVLAYKISLYCEGTGCTLSWIKLGCCAGESVLAPLLAFITMHRFLWWKKTGWRHM
ncbi:Hypothetical protein D9617_15g042310 [Elsinoe fawcettii]|nr:Hypothetical protein D9617_15g042310 [Elsinoe fawcettii]